MHSVLAPLRGVTDVVFRNCFAACFDGFDRAVAPFITATNTQNMTSRRFRDLHASNRTRLPIVPQLIGNNADHFLCMARHLHAMGFEEINLNLGCPSGTVTRKKRGAGLLPYPDRIASFCEVVFPAMPCALSVKCRLGMESAAEISPVLDILNRYPVKELIVHPRTASQQYRGIPHLAAFESVLHQAAMPVCYNGDITSAERFGWLRHKFPSVSCWMIGRGAVQNPFLGEEIKGLARHGREHPVARIRRFHELLFESRMAVAPNPGPLLGAMKEFWSYLAVSFENGATVLKAIRTSRTTEQYCAVIDSFFDRAPQWRPPRDDGEQGFWE
jgi:tRNA-dihydrouridine synthase